jgi:hypothetical protein
MPESYEAARSRRQELLEQIALAADEIGELDRAMPILRSQALEADLLQAEPVP